MFGPILWNIVYDEVLRCPLPPGASVVCYAVDTLVLVGFILCAGWAWGFPQCPRVSKESEAIWFYDKNRRGNPPPGKSINMAGQTVGVRSRVKYPGLVIDSQ